MQINTKFEMGICVLLEMRGYIYYILLDNFSTKGPEIYSFSRRVEKCDTRIVDFNT